MKVTLEKEYRKYYTLEDLERAKAVIKYEKDDECTPREWSEYAAREALKGTDDYLVRVCEASARTAKNYRAYNVYGGSETNTEDMDVWVEGLVKTSKGFLEFGAYLSDIWQTGQEAYKHHMYIQYYTRKN